LGAHASLRTVVCQTAVSLISTSVGTVPIIEIPCKGLGFNSGDGTRVHAANDSALISQIQRQTRLLGDVGMLDNSKPCASDFRDFYFRDLLCLLRPVQSDSLDAGIGHHALPNPRAICRISASTAEPHF
jgi:hypothetical protein